MIADSGRDLRAGHVWTLGAISQGSIPIYDADGRTGLKGENGGSRPSSHHGVENAIHVPANPAVTAHREFHDGRENHPMRGVVRADRAFSFEIVQFLGNART